MIGHDRVPFVSPQCGTACREKAGDQVVDRRFDRLAFADDAAIRPFDPAIAGRDLAFAEHDQATFKARLRAILFETPARLAIKAVIDPHRDMRSREHGLKQSVARAAISAIGSGRKERTGEPAAHGDRDLDRVRLQPALDRRHPVGELCKRRPMRSWAAAVRRCASVRACASAAARPR